MVLLQLSASLRLYIHLLIYKPVDASQSVKRKSSKCRLTRKSANLLSRHQMVGPESADLGEVYCIRNEGAGTRKNLIAYRKEKGNASR